MEKTLEKGVFILSLDFELFWGMKGDPAYKQDIEETRDLVRELLALFEIYGIKTTWATVGKLFLESNGEDSRLWTARDIIRDIQNLSVPQEIASHSFSHKVIGEDCDREGFEEELRQNLELTKKERILMKSYVYPKNRVGFVELLPKYGFTSYRGIDRNWYRFLPNFLKKFAHVFDNYFLRSAPVVLPAREGEIWNIPGSYFFPHARSWASLISKGVRAKKAISGVRKAAKQNKIFHLWFHPFNLASNRELLLSELENVLEEVKRLVAEGELENLTMSELAERL